MICHQADNVQSYARPKHYPTVDISSEFVGPEKMRLARRPERFGKILDIGLWVASRGAKAATTRRKPITANPATVRGFFKMAAAVFPHSAFRASERPSRSRLFHSGGRAANIIRHDFVLGSNT